MAQGEDDRWSRMDLYRQTFLSLARLGYPQVTRGIFLVRCAIAQWERLAGCILRVPCAIAHWERLWRRQNNHQRRRSRKEDAGGGALKAIRQQGRQDTGWEFIASSNFVDRVIHGYGMKSFLLAAV